MGKIAALKGIVFFAMQHLSIKAGCPDAANCAARQRPAAARKKSRPAAEPQANALTAELQKTVATLENERRRFHDVLDALPVYVVLLAPDYHVRFANRFFRERFGEPRGRHCFVYLFGRTEPCAVCETYKVLKTNAPHTWEWTGPDGRQYHVFDFPFADTDGSRLVLEMGIDVTESRQTEERLRTNETRLSEAQHIAHFGNWEWNIATGKLVWSDEIYRIFGLRPQEFAATYNAFLKAVHPKDRELVRAAVNKTLRNNLPYNIDHRIVLPGGSERVVHEHGEVFRDKAGQPIRMVGTVQDVTEHKKIERRDQMITTLLALFVRKSSRKEYLDAVIKILQQASDCRRIGIRIRDDKGRIPFVSSIGFSRSFMEIENDLMIGRDACICTRVLTGVPAPQDLACVTSDGSFRCDNTFDFFAGLPARDKGCFRGVCVKSGFASLSVVPIRYHDHIFGAIHLADKRAGKVPREQIVFIEKIMAPMIGEAISWFDIDQSLRQAGAYHRSLIEASLDPLVTINSEGKITDVNAATEKITGYSRTELIGTDFADYFTDFEKARSGYQQVFREGWVQDYALEIRHRDGRVTPVLYNASVYRDENGKVIGIFAAARDITERKRAEKDIADYQHELRSLSSRLSLAEESARRQLAVALHDTVGQTQALAQIKLDALGELLTDRKTRQAWTEIRGMFEGAVQQTRSLSFELSPPILYELGLDPALEWLGEEFQRRHGFKFHFDSAGDASAVDPSLRVLLFQSVRELLANIVKHAGATHVYIASRIADGHIVVSVRDNGKGFVANGHMPAGKKNSLGLFSIRERMQYSGGLCTVVSAPGRGAAITLSAPVTLKQHADNDMSWTGQCKRKRKQPV